MTRRRWWRYDQSHTIEMEIYSVSDVMWSPPSVAQWHTNQVNELNNIVITAAMQNNI